LTSRGSACACCARWVWRRTSSCRPRSRSSAWPSRSARARRTPRPGRLRWRCGGCAGAAGGCGCSGAASGLAGAGAGLCSQHVKGGAVRACARMRIGVRGPRWRSCTGTCLRACRVDAGAVGLLRTPVTPDRVQRSQGLDAECRGSVVALLPLGPESSCWQSQELL